MKFQHLNDVSVFVEVARANGFRAAAKALNLGAGSVSEAIQRFEDRLGVRLFERSTRSVALTPAGERLFERSLPALKDLESALREASEQSQSFAGTLRLSAPRNAGPVFLNDLLARFAAAYPEITIEVIFNDEKVDLVTSGVDAVIRTQTLVEQESYAVPIGPDLEVALVAAPSYLERAGAPKTPAEITEHDGLCYAFDDAGRLAPWRFTSARGDYSVAPRKRMIVNDLPTLISLAEAGLGLAYVYAAPTEPLIAQRRLIKLFEGETPPLPSYALNYRTKQNMPARLRAFIDFTRRTYG
ncbi:MAG: LysR family transcriptional regulator [Pseudomonadota bacterium]